MRIYIKREYIQITGKKRPIHKLTQVAFEKIRFVLVVKKNHFKFNRLDGSHQKKGL